MLELSTTAASSSEVGPDALGQASGTMVWNQPRFAGLWGLATAKDSLKHWLSAKSFRSFILSRWVFTIYFVTVALNGFVVFNRVWAQGREVEIPSYPGVTALVLLLVLATTKERSQGVYFWAAWSYWIFFSLVGFVNATSVTGENFRLVIQSIGKTWISLIGIPWMAFRIISPDQLPRYTKLLVLSAAFGSILCLIQIPYPELFTYLRDVNSLRGAGTWANANTAAHVLMMALFLSRLAPWSNNWSKLTVYLILLAGLIGTFSRGALLGFVAGEIIYLIIVKNYKRMFLSGSFLGLFLFSWIGFGLLVQNNAITIESKEIRNRAQTFSNLISGKAAEEIETGRLWLWKAGIQDVLEDGSLLFGLGHAGLVKTRIGLAPHNDYIQHFGDGGLLGLGAFLAFLSMIACVFWRCKDLTIRASLMSIIVGHATFCMAGDKNFLMQPIGAYIAMMVMWAHYSREYPGVDKVMRLKRALTQTLAYQNTPAANP